MPSPHWCKPEATPLFQALAAAQHEAWSVTPDRRRSIFLERFRSLVGETKAEPIMLSALAIFDAQPNPPAGFEAPPAAVFQICPRCQILKGTKFTAPQHGRLKLAVLRDRAWLADQFEKNRSCESIATQLECSPSLVMDWARKHELQPAKTANAEARRDRIERMHLDGNSPGEISRELEMPAWEVKQVLAEKGLATSKQGHHHFQAEWWIERIERRGWTKSKCAKAAGIQPHAANYYINRFGLGHITSANATKKGQRRWSIKYPVLADAKQLQALLDEHGSYENVAKVVGCGPTLVSMWARKILGAQKRHENTVPHSAKSWWVERVDRGLTTFQLAAEAGIEEKSARERLRVLGDNLLGRAYANNTKAEKAKRSISAASKWARPREEAASA